MNLGGVSGVAWPFLAPAFIVKHWRALRRASIATCLPAEFGLHLRPGCRSHRTAKARLVCGEAKSPGCAARAPRWHAARHSLPRLAKAIRRDGIWFAKYRRIQSVDELEQLGYTLALIKFPSARSLRDCGPGSRRHHVTVGDPLTGQNNPDTRGVRPEVAFVGVVLKRETTVTAGVTDCCISRARAFFVSAPSFVSIFSVM